MKNYTKNWNHDLIGLWIHQSESVTLNSCWKTIYLIFCIHFKVPEFLYSISGIHSNNSIKLLVNKYRPAGFLYNELYLKRKSQILYPDCINTIGRGFYRNMRFLLYNIALSIGNGKKRVDTSNFNVRLTETNSNTYVKNTFWLL